MQLLVGLQYWPSVMQFAVRQSIVNVNRGIAPAAPRSVSRSRLRMVVLRRASFGFLFLFMPDA